MKRENLLAKGALLLVASMMVTMCTSQVQAEMNSTNIFDIGTVHDLYIKIIPPFYEEMRFSAGDNNGEPEGSVYPTEIELGVYEHTYWQADIADNQTGPFIRVGLRRKSDLALAYGVPNEVDPLKFSMKVDVNRYVAGQTFAGKKKLSLECGSSYAHITEGLAWSIYGATGMVAGRSNWINVHISTDGGSNYDLMGLYNNVEQVDKEYLEDHMPDRHDYGFLYKLTEYNGDLQKTRELETNPFEFRWYPFDHPQYMLEDPTPADWLTQTPQRVDVDQLMKFAVAENFVANSDGTLNKGNNFFYYDWANGPDPNIMDPAYKQPRMYIPWDLDSCLGDDSMSINFYIDSGHIGMGLIQEIDEGETPYGYDTYQAEYYSTYNSLINGPLSKADLLTMITNIENSISTALLNDIHSELAVEIASEGPVAITAEFNNLRTFIADRWDYVDGQLALLGPLPGTSLLNDGFEDATWDTNWNDTAHSWVKDTAVVKSGSSSAWAKLGNAGYFTSDPLDASDATDIHIRFAIQKDDIDSGEFELYYYNGTSYNLITDLDTLGSDDEWLMYSDTITDSQYFVSDFQIRFDAGPNDTKENVWVDDVEITKEIPIVVPDVVGLTQAAAEAAITAATYTVGVVTTAYSDTVAAGNVISQNPVSGTAAAPGTAVDLVVSL
ncbi:MAG: CotH kinase family protein, partial [Planctomycetes bacterium]|nr:CotH kinase family protein [Planctomycetota bacterium]